MKAKRRLLFQILAVVLLVAIGYTMAQLCLVIETILGLLFLHEKKTPAELKHSIAGAVFITLGCILVGLVGSV